MLRPTLILVKGARRWSHARARGHGHGWVYCTEHDRQKTGIDNAGSPAYNGPNIISMAQSWTCPERARAWRRSGRPRAPGRRDRSRDRGGRRDLLRQRWLATALRRIRGAGDRSDQRGGRLTRLGDSLMGDANRDDEIAQLQRQVRELLDRS